MKEIRITATPQSEPELPAIILPANIKRPEMTEFAGEQGANESTVSLALGR